VPTHHHRFVEKYKGLVGFGQDRETDEASLIVFLQKFSDDDLMETLRGRLDDGELDELFQLISRLLRKHLSQEEYHRLFLKDTDKA
jgi:hypothetical protein